MEASIDTARRRQEAGASVAGQPAPGTVMPVQWEGPWYDPWREVGKAVLRNVETGAPLWDALNCAGYAPVRFVAHGELPGGTAYEQFIAQTGRCPTRPGLHDFFNGLCWIQFGATKRRLNQMQAAQIACEGVRPMRGAVRDALTLFDENAAFLHAPEQLWSALVRKQWRHLFVDLRPLWGEARLLLFGHALLEKMQVPRKAITAHVYRVGGSANSLAAIDAWVAGDLRADRLAKKPFAHLPVLGVPGWWPANADPSYYDDAAVFRPAKPFTEVAQ